MTILDTIIAKKRQEVEQAKATLSITDLERKPLFSRACFSLREFVLSPGKNGIIAEYKRASPSKGIINDRSPVEEVVAGYQAAHVSAVSVLTDSEFFSGSLNDLTAARDALLIPLLRKEFIIDEYQLFEAKAHGADVILLIAAVLRPSEIKSLSETAQSLGLSVLLEVHGHDELDRSIMDSVDAIGVNNRNLKDFTVSLEHSLGLADSIPDRFIKVSESGISNAATIKRLRQAGFQAFLIGENFMKTGDPAQAIQHFVASLQSSD
ncbi:indole-3-glycerol phosphate synthase TrpC [Parapedobacter sp. ISTM3]|uniref:Indole-3-glycerol phosphate synthase n=1 Tax=Parapedobacter luteus TaxID=623280 RepID=A0A1T5CYE2_9SPHI|nr:MULTISPECIES: indole-3-glycerol phosphate synthase TrpC [Parapedobacter]MBK1440623.1 indole-3-glycerol phosphate synthase TrpC [Parapedobacter sp. ISTM3]SKB64381.1 indole-3-glycerol phosphate synthase [Parapedobacter luteus]